jgi:phospholipid/cholesterol/gamma-HCH transport system ATP-binding protein
MIEIKDLHKSFNSHHVLDGVNLKIQDGEILSVIGESGVGKSVLIKSVMGLIEPDSGSIRVDGAEVLGMNEKRFNEEIRSNMAIVFQEGALWDSMTVGENINLALQIKKQLSPEEREERIIDSLRKVGLKNVQDVYPEELSGGMMKRVAIARAIATRPKYLFYDEPTTGLDPVLSNVINNLIKKLNDELGVTSLIISHDIKGVETVSNRVAMLYKGKIILTCNAGEMWNQENKIFNDFIRGKVGINEY